MHKELSSCNKATKIKGGNKSNCDENALLLWKLWFRNLAVPLFALPGSLFK